MIKPKPFCVGIVGCGEIGVRHAKTYGSLDGVKVVSVTDVNRASAESLAKDCGARVCADYREILAAGDLDFLDVCTPPSFHREAVVAAFDRGLPVICEKPLASSSADALAMVEAGKKAGKPLMTAFGFRFHPGILKAREILARGDLGRVHMYRNRWAWRKDGWEGTWRADRNVAGGGLLWDMGVHAMDLFRFFFGEVKSAQGRLSVQAPVLRARGPRAVEDSYVLSVESESGVLASLEGSFYLPVPESLITFYGDQGTLTLRFFEPETLELWKPGAKTPELVPFGKKSMFLTELGHWLAALRGEESLSVTGEDGLRAVEIVEGLTRNAGIPIP